MWCAGAPRRPCVTFAQLGEVGLMTAGAFFLQAYLYQMSEERLDTLAQHVGMKIGHACKLKDMLKADLSG